MPGTTRASISASAEDTAEERTDTLMAAGKVDDVMERRERSRERETLYCCTVHSKITHISVRTDSEDSHHYCHSGDN